MNVHQAVESVRKARRQLTQAQSRLQQTISAARQAFNSELLDQALEERKLSPRERQVLQLVVQNKCNKEIAVALHISVRTVKFHISNLLLKYKVESRHQLALLTSGGFFLGDDAPTEHPEN